MENPNELIDSIQRKLNRVLIQSQDLQHQVLQLEQEKRELSSFIEKQKEEIKQLHEGNSLLLLTQSSEKGKENTEARAHIQLMISEIDKCIGLLKS